MSETQFFSLICCVLLLMPYLLFLLCPLVKEFGKSIWLNRRLIYLELAFLLSSLFLQLDCITNMCCFGACVILHVALLVIESPCFKIHIV